MFGTMGSLRIGIRIYLLLEVLLFALASDPAQYCRYGYTEIDFCMGVVALRNRSANAYDLYMRMQVVRSSALGWTAIGTGPAMDGSLMFIVYGDPRSGEAPVLSIRTSNKHHQPEILSPAMMGESHMRTIWADWVPGRLPGTYAAELAFVCYACSRWPGTPISASSNSQPWIWAWNDKQDMADFRADAKLQMHTHHAGNGGWGIFYVDMARTISEEEHLPSLPPLRPGVEIYGTSNKPIGASGLLESLKARPLACAHGILLTAAFLLLFPAGVAALRFGSPKAFKYHWTMQLVGSLLAGIAIILGLFMSRGRPFLTVHQCIGVVITLMLSAQGVSDHLTFLKIRRRTWASHTHTWAGRLIVLFGWVNIITGLSLSGHRHTAIALGALEVLGAFLPSIWMGVASAEHYEARSIERGKGVALRNEQNKHFSLKQDDEDSERRSAVEAKD
ncbi:hypothetical protein TOPH_08478 [Tolypocladium ophioglossoides CBS 100239]|uniref:Cytochrome b561 domain-containing protein n=1 Tax=Tolypocladium ophioglossoides (strain CBS 100239) TaxID=1163406 RepID=A0A0L0MYG1_TOLOC|nr:hypothetical protein TOPH_08478 [Tolypocladium ophioglossoides CBS 100239]